MWGKTRCQWINTTEGWGVWASSSSHLNLIHSHTRWWNLPEQGLIMSLKGPKQGKDYAALLFAIKIMVSYCIPITNKCKNVLHSSSFAHSDRYLSALPLEMFFLLVSLFSPSFLFFLFFLSPSISPSFHFPSFPLPLPHFPPSFLHFPCCSYPSKSENPYTDLSYSL